MKISYISDLHLDFWCKFNPSVIKWQRNTRDFILDLIKTDMSREILVIAGDISHYNSQSMWTLETFSDHYEQVLITYGNHDMYLISKNQSKQYGHDSMLRIKELYDLSKTLRNVHPLFFGETFTYKGVKFGGAPMFYPLKTIDQKMFFHNTSNDSVYITGVDVRELHKQNQLQYEDLLEQNVDVMISHFPVINIDSHFKYNNTACYLTTVSDIRAKHWVFGHSHEQKVYEKPYCTFYMNAIGYPSEKLELGIKSFEI